MSVSIHLLQLFADQGWKCTFGGGGGGQGGTAVLLTNLSLRAAVADAKGLPFSALRHFLDVQMGGSSVNSNSKVGFHNSLCALNDKDVIVSASD